MIKARTPVIAAVAAALLAWGAGTAMAASDTPAPAASSAAPMAMGHGPMNPQKWQQRRAEHAEQLKARLKLTDAQQGAWDAFQKAMQPQAHARLDRAEMLKLTTPERLDRMHALREQYAAEADQREQAIKTFYAQLTAEQQKVFDAQGMHGAHGMQGMHRGMRHFGQPGKADPSAS